MSLLCCDGNRQTKSKLENENKKSKFFKYAFQDYMMKNKQSRKQKVYFITVI